MKERIPAAWVPPSLIVLVRERQEDVLATCKGNQSHVTLGAEFSMCSYNLANRCDSACEFVAWS
jgi:hypothetical protein